MEYNFKLADLFPSEVSLLDNHLIPLNCPQLKNLGKLVVKERVRSIVDDLGKASADAQELQAITTSAANLERGNDKLYVLCDFKENRIFGFLKVGAKKLFLYNEGGVQHELIAPCILDFYIQETRQRRGSGKYLMDKVLEMEKIHVTHFAVDYPTEKMIHFLKKHYNMTHVFPQINNFVMFDGFFDKRADYSGKVARWTGVNDFTDKPLDEVFHFDREKSRLQNSVEFIREHPHLTQRRHESKSHDQGYQNSDAADFKSSQRRDSQSEMHEHSNHGHQNSDAADLQSNGNGVGEKGHWSSQFNR